jgi:hypothetical protein
MAFTFLFARLDHYLGLQIPAVTPITRLLIVLKP